MKTEWSHGTGPNSASLLTQQWLWTGHSTTFTVYSSKNIAVIFWNSRQLKMNEDLTFFTHVSLYEDKIVLVMRSDDQSWCQPHKTAASYQWLLSSHWLNKLQFKINICTLQFICLSICLLLQLTSCFHAPPSSLGVASSRGEWPGGVSAQPPSASVPQVPCELALLPSWPSSVFSMLELGSL